MEAQCFGGDVASSGAGIPRGFRALCGVSQPVAWRATATRYCGGIDTECLLRTVLNLPSPWQIDDVELGDSGRSLYRPKLLKRQWPHLYLRRTWTRASAELLRCATWISTPAGRPSRACHLVSCPRVASSSSQPAESLESHLLLAHGVQAPLQLVEPRPDRGTLLEGSIRFIGTCGAGIRNVLPLN